MDAQPKRGLAVTLILFIFGLTAIISQLNDGFNSIPIGFITNRVQSHGYNITSLSEETNCRVRIIYNLNNTRLKVIQDERKSKIKEVCDMCRTNRTSVECNSVALNEDYYRDPPVMYNFLLVNDKHKVRDWLPKTTLKRFLLRTLLVVFGSSCYFVRRKKLK